VRREWREVRAVEHVSFTIERGEVVGFLGPNGAGKTTTLKLLSGLLHPTSGSARVLGYEPARRDHDLLRRIALVMGQRQSLQWDLPAADAYDVFRAIYGIGREDYRRRLTELTELLELESLLDKPVRQLSLGERMRCELVVGLLHAPDVLFLDEPTLGLDVAAQRTLREFIGEYAQRSGSTIILTSHYMADIEALARRVLVIHHGRLQYDGALDELMRRMSDRKQITVHLSSRELETQAIESLRAIDPHALITDDGVRIEVARPDVRRAMEVVIDLGAFEDVTVEDEPVERVIERVFSHGSTL
jgi:ABC-2 type transport system ATP-binding protein